MLLYFEFEQKRTKADVLWPQGGGDIEVHLLDKELSRDLPTDLFYSIEDGNRVAFIIEDSRNERLVELQNVIARRLQELVQKY